MQIIDGDQKDDFPLWDVHILFFKNSLAGIWTQDHLKKKFKRLL